MKRSQTPREVVNDRHALLYGSEIDVERSRSISWAAPSLRVLEASTLDGRRGRWGQDSDVRPTRRACALNRLATLRTTPTASAPLLAEVDCIFIGRDDRCYARVTPAFYTRVQALCDQDNNRVYPEGPPHAKIHEELLIAIADFDSTSAADRHQGCGAPSRRHPSVQMGLRDRRDFPMDCGSGSRSRKTA